MTELVISAGFALLVALSYAGGLGVVRFMLAMLVVGTHVGSIGGTPAGGVGVAGFFVISGFLMDRTIAAHYQGLRFPRFYLNRCVRLLPPLAVAMAATGLIVTIRDGVGFLITPEGTARYMPVEAPPALFHWFDWQWRPFPRVMEPQFYGLPQAWSLVTEGCFYLVAPLAVWLLARRAGQAFLMVAVVVSASFTFWSVATTGVDWLRSPVLGFWTFGLGMAASRVAGRWASVLPGARGLATGLLAAVWAVTFLTPAGHNNQLPLLVPPLMAAWLVVWPATVRPVPPWAARLGAWSYGVFLGHFIGALGMYWLAEVIFRHTGVFGVFGVPDASELRLAGSAYAFAVVVGAAIYQLFEQPFERWRAVIRRGA